MAINQTTYERDGIIYDIRAIMDEGYWWGKWTCLVCGVKGESSKQCDEVREAIDAAKINLGGHHAGVHLPRK